MYPVTMIKRALLPFSAVAGLGLFLASAALAAPPQSGGQDEDELPVAARLDSLEADFADLRLQLEDTQRQLLEAQARLDRQAQAAKSMLSTLDSAEAAGFAAGINFESRKMLLKGWRGLYNAMEAPAKTKTEKPTRGARRVIEKRQR